MRPTPNEVAEGIRRILADVVRPAIDDEYACARLDEVRAVLAAVDWDDASLRLVREHGALQALAARIADQLGLDAPDVPVAPPHDFAALAEARTRLDAWMVERFDELPSALREEAEQLYLG